jgi:chemotaxis protein methyltransferase CheR
MSADALTSVADLVARQSGVMIGVSQRGSLVAAIAQIAPGMTAERLLAAGCTGTRLERLIDAITVRETFFFRHRAELDTIDWHEALRAARTRGADAVRVWIAACASGEEAYTVGILACEAFGTTTPPVRILATDIAPTAVAQARLGRYGARAVRTLDEATRRRYFSVENRALCVGRPLRALVEVRQHNLVLDSFPPAGSPPLDLILCRNVLIYFDRITVDRVLASLESALRPGGRVVLGAADRLSGQPWLRPPGLTRRRRARPIAPKAPARAQARPSRSVVRAPPPLSDVPTGSHSSSAINGAVRRERMLGAMNAADRGDFEAALQIASATLAEDPLDAEAYFVTGLVELARGRSRAAIGALRRALYINPQSGLTAFKLARAHDSLGEWGPARRAYRQALRTIELESKKLPIAEAHDLAEVTNACRQRLEALAQRP